MMRSNGVSGLLLDGMMLYGYIDIGQHQVTIEGSPDIFWNHADGKASRYMYYKFLSSGGASS